MGIQRAAVNLGYCSGWSDLRKGSHRHTRAKFLQRVWTSSPASFRQLSRTGFIFMPHHPFPLTCHWSQLSSPLNHQHHVSGISSGRLCVCVCLCTLQLWASLMPSNLFLLSSRCVLNPLSLPAYKSDQSLNFQVTLWLPGLFSAISPPRHPICEAPLMLIVASGLA